MSAQMSTRPAPAPRRRAAHLGPERRRPLVLDAALALFAERGYRGTSMEAIAAAAGVTKPVVYECFDGKEPLFRALLDREEERLLEAVAAAMPRAPSFDEVEGLLHAGLAALLSAAASAPDSWRVIFEPAHAGEPAVAERVRRGREGVNARLRELIEPMLAAAGAERADRKAPVLAEVVTSVGEGTVRVLLRGDGGWTPDELAGLVARVAVRGPAAA
ncbi:MAG: helix-turn-helix domain-containing protein [Thermoleophilaceae bacterium]